MWSCHTFFSAVFSSYSFMKMLFIYHSSQPFKTVHFNDSIQPHEVCILLHNHFENIFMFWIFTRKETCSWLAVPPHSHPTSASVTLDLLILYISHDSSDALCPPLWSASLIWHDVCKAHPCCSMCRYFPPFVEVCCCIVFICLMLFTHSWRDGHLGQCHFSAVMDHAAVIIHVQVFMWHELLLLFGVYRGMEEPGYRATLCLTFWGTYHTISSCTVFQFSR